MGFSGGSNLNDVVNAEYVGGTITVGTTQVKAKVGANNLAGRQEMLVYSRETNAVVYFGPSGVTTSTGIPVGPGETVNLPYGEGIDVYFISATAGNVCVVQELS